MGEVASSLWQTRPQVCGDCKLVFVATQPQLCGDGNVLPQFCGDDDPQGLTFDVQVGPRMLAFGYGGSNRQCKLPKGMMRNNPGEKCGTQQNLGQSENASQP